MCQVNSNKILALLELLLWSSSKVLYQFVVASFLSLAASSLLWVHWAVFPRMSSIANCARGIAFPFVKSDLSFPASSLWFDTSCSFFLIRMRFLLLVCKGLQLVHRPYGVGPVIHLITKNNAIACN